MPPQKGPITGAAVRNDPPVPTDWGLVVRPIGEIDVVPEPSTQTNLTAIPANVVALTLLAANPLRLGFTIRNTSPNAWLYVKVHVGGPVVSDAYHTVALGPCGYYEDPFHYVGVVTGVWVGAMIAGYAMVTEYLP